MNQSNLLAVLVILFANMAFVMTIIYYRFEPRWIASYIAVILLYSALYYRRLGYLSEGLRRRLGNTAVTLGAFLSALFFYNFAPGMPWWVAGAAWLGLAAAAFFVYDAVMFHEEEEAARVQLQGPPV